ncbi:MAG: hypothetical protein RR383_09950 [Muribaculaceae bacterium]
MATKIETLKGWFGSRKYPTGAQFAAWLDSFWHKDERVPMASVEGIAEALNSKYDTSDGLALANVVATKSNAWTPILTDSYFIHEQYRWCRVSLIADNGYHYPGYQEFEVFDIDVKALVEQFYSVGNGVYTITRILGANNGDAVADWKIVRYNVIINNTAMSVMLNKPSANTFSTKIYVQR